MDNEKKGDEREDDFLNKQRLDDEKEEKEAAMFGKDDKDRESTDEGQDDEMEYIEIGKNPIPTDLMLPYEVSMFTELHESDAQGGALIITSRGLGKLSCHFYQQFIHFKCIASGTKSLKDCRCL